MMYNIFGVKFVNGDYHDVFLRLLEKQFMVVPSGPGLSTIDKDKRYYTALKSADFAIPDSGFMIILARLFLNLKIKKLSGPKFLRMFLKEEKLKEPNNLFLIDPSKKESLVNRKYLNNIGIKISNKYQYVAPFYKSKEINDQKLIKHLNELKDRPKFIMINLGGGVQEPLGLYIKKHISYKCAIICTGAAIAFETGQQARLPVWVDELYLGWLARVVQKPHVFFIRFLKAFRLVYVFYICKVKNIL